MIMQLFDADVAKILTIMSMSKGSGFQRKELQERTRMNNVTLDNALRTVLNSGIVKKKKRHFFLNLENDYSKPLSDIVLRQYRELKEPPLDAYFSIIEMVAFLSRFGGVDVYLFGSYSKLVFKETSDIDIALVSDSIGEKEKKAIVKAMQKIEKRHGKTVEMHYFGTNFYKNRKDPLVKDIMTNGVRLI